MGPGQAGPLRATDREGGCRAATPVSTPLLCSRSPEPSGGSTPRPAPRVCPGSSSRDRRRLLLVLPLILSVLPLLLFLLCLDVPSVVPLPRHGDLGAAPAFAAAAGSGSGSSAGPGLLDSLRRVPLPQIALPGRLHPGPLQVLPGVRGARGGALRSAVGLAVRGEPGVPAGLVPLPLGAARVRERRVHLRHPLRAAGRQPPGHRPVGLARAPAA